MRIFFKKLAIVAALLFLFSSLSFAADPMGQNVPLRVTMTVQQAKADDRGTDISNIYVIQISSQASGSSTEKYNIGFFIDGRLTEVLNSQTLPFTLTRNFKGLTAGRHEIEIQLEDYQKRIVATEVSTVNVKESKNP